MKKVGKKVGKYGLYAWCISRAGLTAIEEQSTGEIGEGNGGGIGHCAAIAKAGDADAARRADVGFQEDDGDAVGDIFDTGFETPVFWTTTMAARGPGMDAILVGLG